MNDLIVKSFENHEVRVIMINEDPWFVAADICSALNIKNTTETVGKLDDNERSRFNLGRQGETKCC